MDNIILQSNLEALLFVSDEPLNLKRLAEVIEGASREELSKALDDLMQRYEEEKYGIQLVEIAGGYQLCTKPACADAINKLFEKRRKRTLSKAALETLAIIAYKQPITRGEVEAIRGVNVDGAVHTLLERRLVKIAGRQDAPGRPFLYRTTKSFLQYFGLKNLKDLPKVEDVSQGLNQQPQDAEDSGVGDQPGLFEQPEEQEQESAAPQAAGNAEENSGEDKE
jgi:segregation and condensation protein B